MNEINVIIIGSLHHNTLGVLRSIGEAGITTSNIDVLLVERNHSIKNLISSCKYVDKERVFFVNAFEEIVPWLLNKSNNNQKSVIICCSDGASEAVISENEILKYKYWTPETLIDISELSIKSKQGLIAKEAGMNVPLTSDFQTHGFVEWNEFPCIVKPFKSGAGARKSDIHIIHSRSELDKTLKIIKAENIQIQQYIDKDIEFQLIGCSLNSGELIIIPGFTNIIRQPKTTNTGYLLYSPINELKFDIKPVERFIQIIGYSGLFSIEFIRGKDKHDYFLEINLRNDGNAYCVKCAGVNLPYIWAFFRTNNKLPDIPVTFSKPVYFMPDFNDLKLALHEIGLFKWFRQFINAESHSIYNKEDIEPFKYELFRQIKRILKF